MSTVHTVMLVLIIAFFCFFAIGALLIPERDIELSGADVRALARMTFAELTASIRQRVRSSLVLRRLPSAIALVSSEGLSERELLARIELLHAEALKNLEIGADATHALHACGLGRAKDELERRIAGGAVEGAETVAAAA